MALPDIPTTHRWIDGGAVVRFVGRGVTGAAVDSTMYCWDRDTGDRVVDLYDQNGAAVTEVAVVDNTFYCAVPKTVAKPVFSVGATGARFAGNDWDMLDQVSAHVMGDDGVVAALVTAGSGSDSRTILEADFGTKAQQDTNATDIAGKVGKGALTVSVWDYGAVGGDPAADTTAINNAATAAGQGGTVLFPRGTFGQSRFKCASGVTIPDFQTWDSGGNSRIGGAAAQTHLDFTALTTGTAVTLGASATLRNLRIAGPGSSSSVTGVANGGSTQTIDGCSVVDFGVNVDWNGVYYGQLLNRVELARGGTQLKLTGCYNVNLHAPRIHCLSTDGTTRGVGIELASQCRSLNVHGGSIEQYATAVKGASNSAHNLHDVYFETAAGNAKGIDCSGKTAFVVNVRDNTVYLSETTAWVDVTTGTSFVLNGSGNKFVCTASTSPAAPIAYNHSATPSGDITLAGDSWADVTLAGTLYVPAVNGVYPRVTVQPPGSIDPSYVKVGRSVVRPLKTVTTTYAITTADETILCSAAATFTVTLPTRTGLPYGRMFEVKNQASSAASVNVARTDGFLENSTSAIVLAPGDHARFIQDGANWHRL